MAVNMFRPDRVMIGATTLGGIQTYRLNRNYQALLDGGPHYDPSTRSVTRIQHVLSFDTVDVLTALTKLWTGKTIPYSALASAGDNFTLTLAKYDSATNLIASGSVHQAIKVVQGIVIPTTLRPGPAGVAVLSCDVYAVFDGTNDPVQHLTSQALAATRPVAAALHKLAGLLDNTTQLAPIAEDWSVNFGILFMPQPGPQLYLCDSAIGTFRPTITFSTTSIGSALALSAFSGAQCGAAGLKLIFGRLLAGVGFDSSGHFSIAARAGSYYYLTNLQLAAEGGSATYTCLGTGADDLTNSPLAWATGASLPSYAEGELYRAGPVYDNSTEVQLSAMSATFGIQATPDQPLNRYWPIGWAVERRNPMFSLRTADLAYLQGLSPAGRAVATSMRFFARKMQSNAMAYADVSTQHALVQINGGYIQPDDEQGGLSGLDEGGFSVVAYVGSGALVTVSTGVAIA